MYTFFTKATHIHTEQEEKKPTAYINPNKSDGLCNLTTVKANEDKTVQYNSIHYAAMFDPGKNGTQLN